MQQQKRTFQQDQHSMTAVTGATKKLLIQRLREIDQLSAKELAIILADAQRIKTAFRLKKH